MILTSYSYLQLLVLRGVPKDISGCASGTSTPFLGTKYYRPGPGELHLRMERDMLRLARAPETRHATPGQENYDAAKAHMARVHW